MKTDLLCQTTNHFRHVAHMDRARVRSGLVSMQAGIQACRGGGGNGGGGEERGTAWTFA